MTVKTSALGTQFDVRLDERATVVTVLAGRVAVGPTRGVGLSARSGHAELAHYVEVGPGQQLRAVAGQVLSVPRGVDIRRTTAWLHRQIMFEREPLQRVANEFNRYSTLPIEIVTPALRNLEISGVFSTDDTDAFIAFLRSLEGVRVEVTATRIRVFRDQL